MPENQTIEGHITEAVSNCLNLASDRTVAASLKRMLDALVDEIETRGYAVYTSDDGLGGSDFVITEDPDNEED